MQNSSKVGPHTKSKVLANDEDPSVCAKGRVAHPTEVTESWGQRLYRLFSETILRKVDRVDSWLHDKVDSLWVPLTQILQWLLQFPAVVWFRDQLVRFSRWFVGGIDWIDLFGWVFAGSFGYCRAVARYIGSAYAWMARRWLGWLAMQILLIVSYGSMHFAISHAEDMGLIRPDSFIERSVALVYFTSLGLTAAWSFPISVPIILVKLTIMNFPAIVLWLSARLLFCGQWLFWLLQLGFGRFIDIILPEIFSAATFFVLRVIVPLCKLPVQFFMMGSFAISVTWTLFLTLWGVLFSTLYIPIRAFFLVLLTVWQTVESILTSVGQSNLFVSVH